MTSLPELTEVPDDLELFNAWAMEQRWGDGLPLIPPTPERVERMLRHTDRPPDLSLGKMPVSFAEATIDKLAVNAVIAGCRPTYFPILITAVEACLEPEVNFYIEQATTHPGAIMLMVNGPLAHDLEINGGSDLFGPGWHANATIGRALRLIQRNVGGAYPPHSDKSTIGTPAKYTFCFAENEAESPWSPYHVDLGYDRADSTVTIIQSEGPHNIQHHAYLSQTAHAGSPSLPGFLQSLLVTLAESMRPLGSNNVHAHGGQFFVGICPEHAQDMSTRDFTKEDLKEYLYHRVRIPFKIWKGTGKWGIDPMKKYLEFGDDELMVPIADEPDDIRVIVIGGPGRHSCWMPNHAEMKATTRLVAKVDGGRISGIEAILEQAGDASSPLR